MRRTDDSLCLVPVLCYFCLLFFPVVEDSWKLETSRKLSDFNCGISIDMNSKKLPDSNGGIESLAKSQCTVR